MTYYVDIDNTVCRTEGTDYEGSVAAPERIAKINRLYDAGHRVVYWTARGTGSGLDFIELTIRQLDLWGAKRHDVVFGKPVYDVLVCDKAFSFEELFGKL